jgi:ubiquinone/menaquinone biosynthesis C-methylase UbiE
VARDRDVAAFDRRADSYERGRLGAWHRRVANAVVDVAGSAVPVPTRVLDVGCGSGLLLQGVATRWPEAVELVGVDPAPRMVERARGALAGHARVRVEQAAAERLPFPDGEFDLIVSALAFDHWRDQRRGLRECARVLDVGGRLVLADLVASWLWPTTVVGRRGRARTPRQLTTLLARARLKPLEWRDVERLGPLPMVQAVVAGY